MNTTERNFARQLVREVQKRKCLYDNTHPDNKNRGKIDEEWEEVAEKMRSTATNVRRRWQNLRGSFGKALNAKYHGKVSCRRTSNFYLMDQMSFLKEYMTLQKPENCWTPSIEMTPGIEIKSERDGQDEAPRSPSVAGSEDFLPASEGSPGPASPELTNWPAYAESSRYERRQPSEAEETSSNFMQQKERPDEDLAFFQGLLPHIRELTKRRKRAFFQLVANELFKSLSEQEVEATPTVILEIPTSG